jgi:hypothetical protein
MHIAGPQLSFPTSFCCNCGDTNCINEPQDTRVTRFFGIGGSETNFNLPIPVCAACRRTTRRRPAGFFSRLLVVALFACGVFLGLLALRAAAPLPAWIAGNLFWISAGLGLAMAFGFYRFRRARPPQTSFYQPVRIKTLKVQVNDLENGRGQVAHLKMAFTNPDYLNIFVNANQDAIKAGHLAAVKA